MTMLFVPFIAVITWNVVLVTCYQPENGGHQPNIDIATVVKHILERLDRMEGKIDKKLNTVENAVKVVETTVRSNMNILMRIGTHVETQEIKIDQVVKKINQADQKITENEKVVREVALQVKEVVEKGREDEVKIETNSKLINKLSQLVTDVVEETKKDEAKIMKAVAMMGVQNEKLSKMLKDNLQNISSNVIEVKGVLTEALPGKMKRKPAASCSWLKEHSYCARTGYYWLNAGGGDATMQYCKMDNDAPVTTVVPTSAHSTKSPTTKVTPTRHPPTRRPTTKPIHHGKSCQDLKDRYPDLESGTYTITVGGKSFEVVCDMDTDDGGWLMVSNVVVKKNSHADHYHFKRIQSDDFTQLKRVTTGRFVLSMKAINSLYDAQPFHEIRFDCTKKYHHRRINLRTMGDAVIEWLVRGGGSREGPVSCGTYTTLDNDTSVLGKDCRQWFGKYNGQTWNNRDEGLYVNPMRAYDKSALLYYQTSLLYDGYNQLYCDDDKDHPNFDNVGSWRYYIR